MQGLLRPPEILQRRWNNGRGDKPKPFLLRLIPEIEEEQRQLLLQGETEFLLSLPPPGLSELLKATPRITPTQLRVTAIREPRALGA